MPSDKFGEQCLASRMAETTTIPESCLHNVRTMFNQSVARRMSWALKRVTTRPEDIAYCWMGIFLINMPLLSGEGSDGFIRLQQEIARQTDDESIFAWTTGDFKRLEHRSFLANHPRQFVNCGSVFRMQLSPRKPYRIMNQYLEFESRAVRLAAGNDWVGDIHEIDTPAHTCLIALHKTQDGTFRRVAHGGNRAYLAAHIKRRSSRAELTFDVQRSFVIALIKSWRNAAVVLQPDSFSKLTRLGYLFGAPNGHLQRENSADNDECPSSSPSLEDEDEWY
ncbi:Hypothetical predicted protein [Lecanosticta acicola]|uniref:Uncharacterized protein n=1 Tax=Lecanosticta acicola TaxID=111012 RepID=A0AAI8YXR7_9PEZI|nr:Hypothetical predicted protein [Lecanosticta acicola]